MSLQITFFREVHQLIRRSEAFKVSLTNKFSISRLHTPGLSSEESSLPVRESWVQSLGQEDPLGKKMATHSSILAWEIPWTEGAWRATVHGVAKQSNTTQQLNDDNGLHRGSSLKLKVTLALLPLPCSEYLLCVLPLPPHCPQHLSLNCV